MFAKIFGSHLVRNVFFTKCPIRKVLFYKFKFKIINLECIAHAMFPQSPTNTQDIWQRPAKSTE